MRRIFGWIMLSIAFLTIFGFVAFAAGIWKALIVFGIAIAFTFLIIKGITFIVEG